MSQSRITPVKFIGRAYVSASTLDSNPDVWVCIDSEDIKGIVLMFFSKDTIENAQAAADALNIWAGKDAAELDPNGPCGALVN
jgi:hypothetical protein